MARARGAPIAVLACLALGAACGGGGGGGGGSTGGGPTAAFTAPATAVAGTPIALDGSASTGALLYHWDFGDGGRGGTARLAHAFAAAGRYTVRLTTEDAQVRSGAATQDVTVSAGPAPVRTTPVLGQIRGLDGTPLPGVAVAAIDGSATATTDTLGRATLALGVGVDVPLHLSKAGFTDQTVVVRLPETVGADAGFEARLAPRAPTLTIADAARGETLAGRDGATLALPGGGLLSASGAAVTGAVQVTMTPIDVTGAALLAFPGRFEGAGPDGQRGPIASLGTVEFTLSQDGQPLQLAPGAPATVELPLYATAGLDGRALAAGDALPLWSLDERTGGWIQEGQGTVVTSAGSPTGLAFRAQVAHLSWWNCDVGYDPYLPQPKCEAQGDIGVPGSNDYFGSATICNLLATVGRGAAGGAAARLAATAAFLPATAATAAIPIQGGVPVKVPPGVDVTLRGTALNGLWAGQVTLNGPSGPGGTVVVPVSRVAGSGDEAITPPFDGSRALATGQAARFRFTAAPAQWAQLTASQGTGSTLQGRMRLLQGTTELAAAPFGAGATTLTTRLPAAGDYVVEITGTAGTPGTYRLQVALLGGLATQAAALPFHVQPTRAAYTTDRYTFDAGRRLGLKVSFTSPTAATLRLLGPGGAELTRQESAGAAPFTWTVAPGAGYAIEVFSATAPAAAGYALDVALSPWAAAAPPLGADGSMYRLGNVRVFLDGQGRPVVGLSTVSTAGTGTPATVNPRLAFSRWDGLAWTRLADDLPMNLDATDNLRPCSGFGLDGAGQPIAAFSRYTAGQAQLVTIVQRWVPGTGWQPVGPNGGQLPIAANADCRTTAPPAVVVPADGAPVVALYAHSGLAQDAYVLRYDGTSWVGLGSATGRLNVGGQTVSAVQLALDPAGAVVVAWTDAALGTYLARYASTPQPGWQPVGPSGGLIAGITVGSLAFDTAGRPVVAGTVAACGTGGCHGELGLFTTDGLTWSNAGPHVGDAGGYVNNPETIAEVVDGSGAVVVWWEGLGSGADIHVERAAGLSWTGLGAADGALGVGSQSYYPGIVEAPSGQLFVGLSLTIPTSPFGPGRTYLLYSYSP